MPARTLRLQIVSQGATKTLHASGRRRNDHGVSIRAPVANTVVRPAILGNLRSRPFTPDRRSHPAPAVTASRIPRAASLPFSNEARLAGWTRSHARVRCVNSCPTERAPSAIDPRTYAAAANPKDARSLENATSRSAVAAAITTTLATSAGDIARKSLRSDRANADFPVTPSPPSG